MAGRGRLSLRNNPWVVVALTMPLLLALRLTEEEEGGGLLGSYSQPVRRHQPIRTPAQEDYFESVTRLIETYSKEGKHRVVRFRLMLGTSLACSAAVPVAVAAGGPGWAVASLGAVAAFAQGMQQLLQDQRIGLEFHSTAVALSTHVREYYLAAGSAHQELQQREFTRFASSVEETLKTQGDAAIDAMRD